MKQEIFGIALLGTAIALCPFVAPMAVNAWRSEPVPEFGRAPDPLDPDLIFDHCNEAELLLPERFGEALEAGRCGLALTHNAAVSSEFYAGPFGNIPVVVARRRGTNIETARVVVIELIGGPAGSIYPDYSTDELAKYFVRVAARDGILTIIPAYIGTSNRSLHPHESFATAILEVSHLIKSLQRTRSGRQICVVGVSMGGYLAGRLKSDFPDVPMLALNPLVTSPAYMRRYFDRRDGVRLYYRPIRKHKRDGIKFRFVGEDFELDRDIHDIFYGSSFNKPMADFLDAKTRDFTIAYSPTDVRARSPDLEAVARAAPGVRFVKTEPVKHAVGDVENFWAFRPTIDEFLHDCANRGSSN